MKMRLGPLVLLCFTAMVFFSSCAREYICQCQIIYTGQAGLPDTITNEYPVTDTKKKAKADCTSQSTSSEKDGVKTEEICDLY